MIIFKKKENTFPHPNENAFPLLLRIIVWTSEAEISTICLSLIISFA
jgi:hypothetical protein